MRDKLLGIDLGTTAFKGLVISAAGEKLGEAQRKAPLLVLSAEEIEQDAEQWWELAQEVIRDAIQEAGVRGEEIAALSVSSQGISFVPLDQSGTPLRNALSWLDTRASAQSAVVLERFSPEELFSITAKRLNPMSGLLKLLWLREAEPEIFYGARRFLMAHDYVIHRLCGRFVTDHSLAYGFLLHDVSRCQWSATLLEAMSIPEAKLPELHWAGSPLVPVREEVALNLGLSEDTLVVVGGHDQKCAALGAGIGAGILTVSLGTATAVEALIDRPVIDAAMRIPTFPAVIPNRWMLEGGIFTTGASVGWLRETLLAREDYTKLDAWASTSPPGANGLFFSPHLSGTGSPHWRAEARGAFYGIHLATSRADMVRAVLEGVAFEIKENVRLIEDLTTEADRLVLLGGGARSELWARIISSVVDKPVSIPSNVETACLGACILAGVGAGIYGDAYQGQEAVRMEERLIKPDPSWTAQYRVLYNEYQAVEQRLLV